MKSSIKQFAIIGSTASGKTALSISAAKNLDAYILSLDSLSIYKEIDIASAKPSIEEREGIVHFGIDVLYPNQQFDVTTYIKLYKEAYNKAKADNKNLIIVGGTSFYLKMLIDGISDLPTISNKIKEKTKEYLANLPKSYDMLKAIDPKYMSHIDSNDNYRIEKAMNIYLETSISPTKYFDENPPLPTINEQIPIYQIDIDRAKLRERISLRTKLMIKDGLIDEVTYLERRYTRTPNCMKSIGIKETLDFLDGIYDRDLLIEKITTNTARLAKRQATFNNSQFDSTILGTVDELRLKLR